MRRKGDNIKFMTQEQKDAAWRSLPEDYKKELKEIYESLECDSKYKDGYAQAILMHTLFGKHNLTESEEEKPFKVGDRVRLSPSAPLKNRAGFGYLFVKFPSIIKELEGNKALISYFDYELRDVPVEHLIPYTEEKPKNGKRVDFPSSSLQNRKNLTENDISSVSKETAEDLSNLMDEVNNFIERNRIPQVDWLAYRMELAKEVVNGLLFTGKSPETIVDETTTIVNGIVERLKGGEYGKV